MNENEIPELELPDKNLNISGVMITLCNELIQKINEQLNISFTCDASLDEIVSAFTTNEKIEYDDQCYEKYQVVKEFEMKIDNMNTTIYHIALEQIPEEEPEVPMTEDQQFAITYAVMMMGDEDALEHRSLFENYEDIEEGAEIVEGLRLNYKGGLWKCNKTHNKNSTSWYPGAEATLFEQLDKDEHAGTEDDPIPVPESVTTSGFTYIYGKYYLEGEDIYLCKRGNVPNPEEMYGEEIKLNYAPSNLIGQYFEKV